MDRDVFLSLIEKRVSDLDGDEFFIGLTTRSSADTFLSRDHLVACVTE